MSNDVLQRKIEAKYTKFVQLREMLSKILQEKAVYEATLAEINALIEKLSTLSEDTEVYKMEGFVLVKTKKNELLKELESKKEDLEIKIKVAESKEKKIKEDLERLQNELRKLAGAGSGAAPIGG